MPLVRHINAFEDQAEVLAALDVGQMWDRLRGEFLDEFVRLDRQGITGAELERELLSFMEGLSARFDEDIARKSSGVAYNQGRAAEILTQAEAEGVQFVVRSEVLDNRTCPTCARLDSTVVAVGSDDFNRLMPPALCEGGDRCRGFYIPVGGGIS